MKNTKNVMQQLGGKKGLSLFFLSSLLNNYLTTKTKKEF